MKAIVFVMVLTVPAMIGGPARAEMTFKPGEGWQVVKSDIPEKWCYTTGACGTEQSTQRLIQVLQDAKAAGCTHILFTGAGGHRIPTMGPEFLTHVKRVREELKKLDLKLVPLVFPIGYSGWYFDVDSNLAAGLPVRNMPYVVKGKTATPDPGLVLDASGLGTAKGGLMATFPVKPFMHYRVSFVMTGEYPGDQDTREKMCVVTSSGGKRRNCWLIPVATKDVGGKKLMETTFNTLEGTEIRFSINPRGCTVEDVKIEPAGTLLILRRALIPLTVTSADGRTVYEEGKDFKPVSDPVVMERPFPGEFTINHPASAIELADGSRIKDGQKLLVSFWHAQRIYRDQDIISMQDPRTMEIMEKEIKNDAETWQADGYMMNYDEIRVAGWEPQPKGENLTPGQMLARHVKAGYDLIRKYAPKAKIYAWSDMFTPYHNARKGYYYLVNGDWDGSWAGLPKDVIILNWFSEDAKAVRFFADQGHQQVLCGYYDAGSTDKMKKNIRDWMTRAQGVPGVLGFMYTTWGGNYSHLKDYFQLLDTYNAGWK